jgi:hypothetical protein
MAAFSRAATSVERRSLGAESVESDVSIDMLRAACGETIAFKSYFHGLRNGSAV